jgi:predicted SAM-dependent methyltransferase
MKIRTLGPPDFFSLWHDTKLDGPLTPDATMILEPESRDLNVGCGTHYADGWVNTDSKWQDGGQYGDTHPDVITSRLPFRDGWFDRVYLGHVMEHVPWETIGDFLSEVGRVLAPGGTILATGPDIYRTLFQWCDGVVPWSLVESVLEHREKESPDWPGSAHQWNCHEARMVQAFQSVGAQVQTIPVDLIEPFIKDGWPIVNWSGWQCAMYAYRPTKPIEMRRRTEEEIIRGDF